MGRCTPNPTILWGATTRFRATPMIRLELRRRAVRIQFIVCQLRFLCCYLLFYVHIYEFVCLWIYLFMNFFMFVLAGWRRLRDQQRVGEVGFRRRGQLRYRTARTSHTQPSDMVSAGHPAGRRFSSVAGQRRRGKNAKNRLLFVRPDARGVRTRVTGIESKCRVQRIVFSKKTFYCATNF